MPEYITGGGDFHNPKRHIVSEAEVDDVCSTFSSSPSSSSSSSSFSTFSMLLMFFVKFGLMGDQFYFRTKTFFPLGTFHFDLISSHLSKT